MSWQIAAFTRNPLTGNYVYSVLCDTAADLPASITGTDYDGPITQGCTATIIADGSKYTANSSGTWVLQPTSSMTINLPDVYSESEVDALLAPMQADITKTNAVLPDLVDDGAKNVLRFDAAGAGTANGLTYTVNSDGSVTVSGSKTNPSTVSYAYLRYNNSPLYIDDLCNGEYVLSGCPSGGGSSTYRLYAAKGSYAKYDDGSGVLLSNTSETGIQVIISIIAGYDLTAPITFKPMICKKTDWDISHTFEPFALTNPEITPVAQTVVNSVKNYLILTDIDAQTSNRVTISYNGDGSYTVDSGGQTASADGYFYLARSAQNPVFTKGTVISGCTGGSDSTYYLSIAGTSVRQYGDAITLSSDTSGSLLFNFKSGQTFNNMIIRPMVCSTENWNISPKFEPHYLKLVQTSFQVKFSDLTWTQSGSGLYYSSQVSVPGVTRIYSATICGFANLRATDSVVPACNRTGSWSGIRLYANTNSYNTGAWINVSCLGEI